METIGNLHFENNLSKNFQFECNFIKPFDLWLRWRIFSSAKQSDSYSHEVIKDQNCSGIYGNNYEHSTAETNEYLLPIVTQNYLISTLFKLKQLYYKVLKTIYKQKVKRLKAKSLKKVPIYKFKNADFHFSRDLFFENLNDKIIKSLNLKNMSEPKILGRSRFYAADILLADILNENLRISTNFTKRRASRRISGGESSCSSKDEDASHGFSSKKSFNCLIKTRKNISCANIQPIDCANIPPVIKKKIFLPILSKIPILIKHGKSIVVKDLNSDQSNTKSVDKKNNTFKTDTDSHINNNNYLDSILTRSCIEKISPLNKDRIVLSRKPDEKLNSNRYNVELGKKQKIFQNKSLESCKSRILTKNSIKNTNDTIKTYKKNILKKDPKMSLSKSSKFIMLNSDLTPDFKNNECKNCNETDLNDKSTIYINSNKENACEPTLNNEIKQNMTKNSSKDIINLSNSANNYNISNTIKNKIHCNGDLQDANNIEEKPYFCVEKQYHQSKSNLLIFLNSADFQNILRVTSYEPKQYPVNAITLNEKWFNECLNPGFNTKAFNDVLNKKNNSDYFSNENLSSTFSKLITIFNENVYVDKYRNETNEFGGPLQHWCETQYPRQSHSLKFERKPLKINSPDTTLPHVNRRKKSSNKYVRKCYLPDGSKHIQNRNRLNKNLLKCTKSCQEKSLMTSKISDHNDKLEAITGHCGHHLTKDSTTIDIGKCPWNDLNKIYWNFNGIAKSIDVHHHYRNIENAELKMKMEFDGTTPYAAGLFKNINTYQKSSKYNKFLNIPKSKIKSSKMLYRLERCAPEAKMHSRYHYKCQKQSQLNTGSKKRNFGRSKDPLVSESVSQRSVKKVVDLREDKEHRFNTNSLHVGKNTEKLDECIQVLNPISVKEVQTSYHSWDAAIVQDEGCMTSLTTLCDCVDISHDGNKADLQSTSIAMYKCHYNFENDIMNNIKNKFGSKHLTRSICKSDSNIIYGEKFGNALSSGCLVFEIVKHNGGLVQCQCNRNNNDDSSDIATIDSKDTFTGITMSYLGRFLRYLSKPDVPCERKSGEKTQTGRKHLKKFDRWQSNASRNTISKPIKRPLSVFNSIVNQLLASKSLNDTEISKDDSILHHSDKSINKLFVKHSSSKISGVLNLNQPHLSIANSCQMEFRQKDLLNKKTKSGISLKETKCHFLYNLGLKCNELSIVDLSYTQLRYLHEIGFLKSPVDQTEEAFMVSANQKLEQSNAPNIYSSDIKSNATKFFNKFDFATAKKFFDLSTLEKFKTKAFTLLGGANTKYEDSCLGDEVFLNYRPRSRMI